jgi:RHS repeat-associated protein
MTYAYSTAQSSFKNYVQTKTFLDDTGTTFLRHIDYYDELGYVSETVDVGCNTSQTPVLTRTEYTAQLKPSLQWAPVPVTGLDYLNGTDALTAERTTYSDYRAYSENLYGDFLELESTLKPGDAWEYHPVTIARHAVPSNTVRKYSVGSNGELIDSGMYPYGLLTSTMTTDEDGLSITVYSDMHENTILERRGTNNDTYYVYDNYGRLSYVLPPMCQLCSTSELPEYWYKYTYDDRGRCTEKQLPGCAVVEYWYDEANRIQSEQDGHLRSQSLYRNYSYDGIGRLTLQVISSTRGEATESNATVVEIKNYYDDYTSCRQEFSQPFSVWADSINAHQMLSTVARGCLTATLHTTSDNKKYFEIYGYDELGRMSYKLSAYSSNWLKAVHTAYNFVGDVVAVNENVYKSGAYFVKIPLAKRRTVNTYHPGTRLLANTAVTQIDKNGNTSTQTVSCPTYDFLGNVIADNRPGTAADMTYTYDMLHGWLTDVSSPSGFSELLRRETATNALFSGNIASMQWRNTSNGEQHGYDYTYDVLGRLIDALYSSSVNGNDGHFDELVTYNSNGSITSLQRYGMKNNGLFGLIDDLTITYDGNRLLKVTDDAEALNYSDALDFNDGDDATCEYDYDSNGALTRDSNRGINSITYDYGHHPYYINMNMASGPRNTTNDYTPDGRKLSSKHKTHTPTLHGYTTRTTTDLYVDDLMLRGDTTLLWRFGGGYVELNANGTPTSWNYYITDHLGSTRMVVDSNDSIRETISYYPFGSEMRMENPALLTGGNSHPFRFTGKELDRLNSLNMYDFGARWYDVAGVPMWTSIDPLAEKYYSLSPYNYCGNNPVNAIDERGDSVCILNLGNGTNQHLGMLIQNDKGKWSYYSFNGTSIYSSTSGSLGGAPNNNLGEKTFDSPTAFLYSQYNSDGSKELIESDKINGYGYTEGYILPTSHKEDIIIRDNFVKTVNDGYDLISNQCADAVKNALNSVGIDTSVFNYDVSVPLPGKNSPSIPLFSINIEPYFPSKTFEAIRENNPNGWYIKK